MKKVLFSAIIITVCILSCQSKESQDNKPKTILYDADQLRVTKQLIKDGDKDLQIAYNQLLADAALAIQKGPYTVTDKTTPAPSGDIHDYASYSRYWWPDPQKQDGLPYIRKDGETNPASQNTETSDRPRIGAFGESLEILGLAYYYTDELHYAKKAAELLRVWFIDDATYMNPNVNHAQCRPGHNLGSKSGVLDGRILIKALETALLISDSGELSEEELRHLRDWANEYYTWLTTNPMALKEAESKNNHGSFYDVQAIYFALYAGEFAAAKNRAESFINQRIKSQIEIDGTMPHEMQRTKPLFYSIFNLHAIFLVASLAEKVDVDIWQHSQDNTRLTSAIELLLPYADQQKQWPQATLGNADRMYLYPLIKLADIKYPGKQYKRFAEELPKHKKQRHRCNLALSLMR